MSVLDGMGLADNIPSFASRIKSLEETIGEVHDPLAANLEEFSEDEDRNEFDISTFIEILENTAAFFDLSEILKLATLNKTIYAQFFTEDICLLICSRILKYTSVPTLKPSMVLEHFQEFSGIECYDSSDLFELLKNAKNLIKNPCGEEGFDYWEVYNGGSGMVVEYIDTFKDRKAAIITSYDWSSITQTVELAQGRKRRVVAGILANRRIDCGGYLKLRLNAAGEEQEFETEMPDKSPIGGVFEWVVFTLKADVDENPQSITVSYHGKDSKYWAGQYGTRFGYCFVYVFDLND